MARGGRVLAGVVLIGVLAVPGAAVVHASVATRPSTAPATRPSGEHRSGRDRMGIAAGTSGRKPDASPSVAVSAAVRELSREYAAHLRDPRRPARLVCDYFTAHPDEPVTPEAILAALERPVSRDARIDGYVKWQLLSGVPGKFEAALLPRVLRAYKLAPEPQPAPGVTQEERSTLELARRSARQQDIEKLNQQINQMQTERREANEPIINYRNELFARLPATYDSIRAGLEDAFVRMKAGADTQSILDAAIKAVHEWMPAAGARELSDLAQLVGTLSKERGPQFYDSAEWNERYFHVVWRKRSPDLNKYDQLGKLQRELNEQARSPAASLKFRDQTGAEPAAGSASSSSSSPSSSSSNSRKNSHKDRS